MSLNFGALFNNNCDYFINKSYYDGIIMGKIEKFILENTDDIIGNYMDNNFFKKTLFNFFETKLNDNEWFMTDAYNILLDHLKIILKQNVEINFKNKFTEKINEYYNNDFLKELILEIINKEIKNNNFFKVLNLDKKEFEKGLGKNMKEQLSDYKNKIKLEYQSCYDKKNMKK